MTPEAQAEIEKHFGEILKLIEPDTHQREGLADTPKRVAKMYREIFRGYDPTQLPNVTTFRNGADGMVVDEIITDEGPFHSNCEHHACPFFGSYHFGYLPSPDGKILGLSKVARVVDYYAARLQVQERLVQQVVEHLWDALSEGGSAPRGMGLIMRGKHLCKSMRGVKKDGWMRTSCMKGLFKDKPSTKDEFMRLVELGGI